MVTNTCKCLVTIHLGEEERKVCLNVVTEDKTIFMAPRSGRIKEDKTWESLRRRLVGDNYKNYNNANFDLTLWNVHI